MAYRQVLHGVVLRMSYRRSLGFDTGTGRNAMPAADLHERINLNLAALGEAVIGSPENSPSLSVSQNLINSFRARNERMDYSLRPPVDQRIEEFFQAYLGDDCEGDPPRLPGRTFNLLQHGMARALSLPAVGDHFKSDIIDSYRLANGVLHNPRSDRRTTSGVFHVAEGGLPIPADKKAVPRLCFAGLLRSALTPPRELLLLPYTSEQQQPAYLWTSLLLRPTVSPAVPGLCEEQRMEIRFFAPGSMVCNLDFVESIFGNAGDPYLAANDAGLDLEHWSGHTGCVILAPQMLRLRKRELGLPHVTEATERQRRDGMCWEDPEETYNDGGAFKITARSTSGTIVTLIADNYFGYCKKEVKTQIGFAANMLGLSEEEHAGGTLAFAAYDLGHEFSLDSVADTQSLTLSATTQNPEIGAGMQPAGYAVDQSFPEVIYLPPNARFSLTRREISWTSSRGYSETLPLRADRVYLYPNGYRVELGKLAADQPWRLVGTSPRATHCHKPCTVSGGGKSEISKPIADAVIYGAFYIDDLQADLDAVETILQRDYRHRYRDPDQNTDQRAILSDQRSLGSVIKLLTPSRRFTDEHNAYIRAIPAYIKELVVLVKRVCTEDGDIDWRSRFSVDIVNGEAGHALRYRGRKLINTHLRVGYETEGAWRVFSLRDDFSPARKVQTEDDITVSAVVPAAAVGHAVEGEEGSVKLVHNCEYRLFQRPDEAIHRGYDRVTEQDFSHPGNFLSNYEPLDRGQIREMVEDALFLDEFTPPMQATLQQFANADEGPAFLGCTARPRLVDGKPTRNPRYLQTVGRLEKPRESYIADVAARLSRLPDGQGPVHYPVDALLPGRRNNPPENGVRALAVFNPVHYLPLPEAFMEFTSSMTGRSPSTTGAGSEGALTKAPFNALLPIVDLNNALVSTALTGLEVFLSSAGCIGPRFRVDHDISLLVPEVWCRMHPHERRAKWLLEQELLEPVPAIEFEGRTLPTRMLGYRINEAFVDHFFGRVFNSPEILFEEWMLKPELQDVAVFADGLDNMLQTHRAVAENYFADGSIDDACPPLRAMLHIMRDGEYEGHGLESTEFRRLFEPAAIISSDWYRERLEARCRREQEHWHRLQDYVAAQHEALADREHLKIHAARRAAEATADDYRERLRGTLGLDPSLLG